MKEYGDNESGGNRKENPGKKVEAARACYEKRGALYVGRIAMEMKVQGRDEREESLEEDGWIE